MTVRNVVTELVELGPLPVSNAAAATIAEHQVRLMRFAGPVTDEQAEVLVRCFAPDDCHGLAWTLHDLIETASAPERWGPGAPRRRRRAS